MPIEWTIEHRSRSVVAVARGLLLLTDIEACLDSVVVAAALPYRKLFDMTEAIVSPNILDRDIMALAARISAYTQLGTMGSLAIVADRDGREFARLFTALIVANRSLWIFGERAAAQRWLAQRP